MRKDPTEFRNRFAMYKDGKKPYEAGRPVDDERYVEFAELQANQWANEVNGPYNNEYRDNEITNEIMLNILSDNTYDYKNYVKDNVIIPVKFLTTAGGAHFSDKYKTVYHPTFSNQSLYSGLKSLYNPRGTEGGSWSKSGDVYYPSKSQIDNSDFNYNKTREYLNYAEKNPVKIQMPKYDTGTGDRDYLPLYEYDIEVTPQGVSAQKHKRITNEQDWLKYWGDKGATSVSRSMHEQAPGYAAAITAPADLITGIAALPELVSSAYLLGKGLKTKLSGPDGKIFNSRMLYNPRNWYRSVGKDAIKDAKTTGVIRGSDPNVSIGEGSGPWFGRGRPGFDWLDYIIEADPNLVTFIDALKYQKGIKEILPVESKTMIGNTSIYDVPFEYGQEGFPINVNTTPISNFDYYLKYPLFGWRLKSFKK